MRGQDASPDVIIAYSLIISAIIMNPGWNGVERFAVRVCRAIPAKEPYTCARGTEERACTEGTRPRSLLKARRQPAAAIRSSIASCSPVPLPSIRQPVARSKSVDSSALVRRCGAHQVQVGINCGSVPARPLTVPVGMIAPLVMVSPLQVALPLAAPEWSGVRPIAKQLASQRCPPPLRLLQRPSARVPAQPSHHRLLHRELSMGPPHPPAYPRTASTTTSRLRHRPSA